MIRLSCTTTQTRTYFLVSHKQKLLSRISLTVCLVWVSIAGAVEYPEIVIDGFTGTILHEQNADQVWYPASLTKMMTLYLTFQALASGELTADEQLEVSANASSQPASRLGLTTGEKISVEQAILAVATISANDVAVVLAERLAVDETEFARKMTAQAVEMGMQATRFKNASGLPDSKQVTTAQDMVLLSYRLLQDFPKQFKNFATQKFVYKGQSRANFNGMLRSYSGVDGIKTGFTCASGYNLAASVQREGRRLIGVVLGGASGSARSARMRRLLDLGFAKLKDGGTGPVVGTQNIAGAINVTPPVRLSASECGQNRILTNGKLPGWGILLGVYNNKNQARAKGISYRTELYKIIGRSGLAILKRKFKFGASWKLVLVGLKRSQAGKACRYLRSSGRRCIAVSPQRMNSRGFSQR